MCFYHLVTRMFLQQRGLEGRVTPAFLKKKWENLKQKYKVAQLLCFYIPPYILNFMS